MRSGLLRALAFGAMTGIRSSAGLLALTRSARVPDGSALATSRARTLALAALAGETLADKTGLLPSRTDLLPWAGRAMLGGATASVEASWSESPRTRAALIGAAGALVTTWLATSTRKAARARGLPDLVPALAEDLIVARLVRTLNSDQNPELGPTP